MQRDAQQWLRTAVCSLVLQYTLLQTAALCQQPPLPPPEPAPTATKKIGSKDRQAAERHYLHGAKALASRDFRSAEQSFAKAYVLDPDHTEYLRALSVAQEHRITSLLQTATQVRPMYPEQAERLMAEARGIDQNNPRVLEHDQASRPVVRRLIAVSPARQRVQLAGAITLLPTAVRQSFHIRGDIRELAKTIASAYGIQAAIDPDLQEKTVRIDLDDVDYTTAMRVFGMLSDTFNTPLDTKSLLVAEDNAANRTRFEHLLEEVIALPGYSTEQINEAATMVRTVFELKQVSVEPQLGAIAIRAPEDTLNAIDATLNDLLDSGSEVMIDMKLYSVDSEKYRNLGITLPQSITAFSVASEARNIVSQNASVIQQLIASGVLPANLTPVEIAAYLVFVAGLGTSSALKNTFLIFGGGLTQLGLTSGNFPVLNLALRESDARSLDDLQLRVADRATAVFKSGTRYPIQTSLFSDVANSTTSSLAGINVNGTSVASLLSQYLGTSSISSQATVPQIQYEDLGLTVSATPRVQKGGQLEMKLEVKVSALSGQSLNGIPVVASRQFSSTMALKEGESVLMASNVNRSESYAVSGIPGLSEIPGFQGGTNKSSDKITGNLVLVVTPHIVRQSHNRSTGPYIPLEPRKDTD